MANPHPLANRHMRDDVLDQVRRSLRHAPRAARGTKPPALAAECHQLVVAAVAAAQAQEAVRQDAALDALERTGVELVFDEGRQARTCGGLALQAAPGQWPGLLPGTKSPPDCLCPGLASAKNVLLDQPVQRGLLGPVALAVDRGSIRRPMARTGLPTDGLHALLTRYRRRRSDEADGTRPTRWAIAS